MFGRPIDPWERGSFVLGYEGLAIGKVDVSGLESITTVLRDIAAHRRTRWPELRIVPQDSEATEWLLQWSEAGSGVEARTKRGSHHPP